MATTKYSRVEQRFWKQVLKTPTCWLWLGGLKEGYGRVWLGDKREQAHRFSYKIAGNTIPDGMVLDHICRVRFCVNPAHLRVCTIAENVLAPGSIVSRRKALTHCPHGHAYTPDNVYRNRSNGRLCKTCVKGHAARRYAAMKKDL